MSAERGPGRFLLEALLGEGGFCTVHRAKDLTTGAAVALKVLRPELDTPEHREALLSEYKILSRLRHPNLIVAVEFGIDDQLGAHLVLELFEGDPLRRFCEDAKGCEQIQSLVQLCRALNFLHARGLVHGDLKPENVLVARNPAGLHVKLLDLGFAVQVREGHLLPKRGTPCYIAPEVLAGMPADHRADLYSLGVLILDCFVPSEIVVNALVNPQLGALEKALAELPPALGPVARNLLLKDPKRRPATASDVIEALGRMTGSPIPIETSEGIRAALKSIGMVGRRKELEEILAACSAPRGSELSQLTIPSVLLLHGEAGVGKTLLLDEISDSLRRLGIPLHRTACPERGGAAFHPFKDFLENPVLEAPEQFASCVGREADELSPGWGPYDRTNRLDQVTQALLSRLAEHRGVVIVEDLQLADEETFEVFLRLVPRAISGPFTIIASFRTEGVLAARLASLIKGYFTGPHIRSIRIERLTREETRELLGSFLGPHRDSGPLAEAIFKICGGNPLFLVELLRGLVESGQITGGPFRWKLDAASIAESRAPRGLRDLVRRRLAGVSEDGSNVLGWLSVLGEPAGIHLVHEASGLPYAELRRLLASLLTAGLIAKDHSFGEEAYTFSHDLYRKALYESLPPARRQAMHRSAGVAFERLFGEAHDEKGPTIAYHFTQAGDQEKGPRYALAAGARARQRGAFHQAIRLYTDAVNLIPDSQMDLRFDALEILAGLLRQVGEPVRSERFYMELLLAARSRGDVHREAVALTQIGRILADRGSLAEAEAFTREGLAKHRSMGNVAGQAEAYLVLAIRANKAADNKVAADLGTQAKALAEAVGSQRLYGLSVNSVGLALTAMRRYEEALQEFMAWLRVAEETHDIIAQTLALNNIGLVHLERGCYEAAETWFSRALSRAMEDGLMLPAACASINASEIARLRGSLRLSRERARDALAMMERAEQSAGIQYCIYTIGLLDLEQGALGEAAANIERSLGISEEVGAKGAAALTRVALGDLHIQLGDLPEAQKLFLQASDGGKIVGDDLIVSLALAGRAEALARARLDGITASGTSPQAVAPVNESVDEARGLAEEAFAIAERIDAPHAKVRADLAGALACLAAGDLEAALHRAHRAASEAESRGMRPDKARALLAAGMIHARAGRHPEADSSLRDACALADEMGLPAVQARARAELASLAAAGGDHSRADDLAREGAEIVKKMTQSLPEPSDQDRFLAVGWRRALLEQAATAGRRAQAPARPKEAARPRDRTRESAGPALGSKAPASGAAFPEPDLRAAVAGLLDEALGDAGCDRGMIFLIAPDGASEIAVARGLEFDSIRDARSYCRGVVDRAAQGEEIFVVDTSRDERFAKRRSVSLFHIVSIVCVPLRFRGKVMGALYLDTRAGGRLLRSEEFERVRAVAGRMTGRIREAWERERARDEQLLKQRALCRAYRLDAIVGESPAMRKLFRILEAVIASDCNVLIAGESGTGKELAARAIHFSGRRKAAPFVLVDCGAIQDSLVESELFGHRRGAFTGAEADRAGLFEEADGGTLFLDEVTNTSTAFQAKLLRVLQMGEFRRVGDPAPRKVDVRIIAATNADLDEAIREGRFREDLYYRLNVVPVRMPPLRERREDIPALAEHVAKAFCEKEKVAYRGIGETALRRLCEHDWPGNVRELKNAVEAALVLSRDGAVRREFLPEAVRGGSFEEIRDLLKGGVVALEASGAGDGSPGAGAEIPIADAAETEPARGSAAASGRPGAWLTEDQLDAARDADDRARIFEALRRAEGDKSLAAVILGWSRMTLYRKMQRLGIDYATGKSIDSQPA